MATVEIPYSQWGRRLDEFSAVHEGWLVSIDILGSDVGAQHEVSNLPLLGISLDRANGEDLVDVAVERPSGDHLSHEVPKVRRVWIEQIEAGRDAAAEFESADGTKTIVRFREAARPETVDGVSARR
jgi:hypothetical protein